MGINKADLAIAAALLTDAEIVSYSGPAMGGMRLSLPKCEKLVSFA